jgi:hypothetical protein
LGPFGLRSYFLKNVFTKSSKRPRH